MSPLHKPSPTIRDVARQAGISVATVSRVINQTAPVSEEVAARVRAVMAEMKFVPHTAARNLATRKTKSLGLLISNIAGDFFVPLLSGIESVAHDSGFDLLIATSHRHFLQEVAPIPLGAHNTDGLLIFTGSLTDDDLAEFYESGLPLVLIYQSPPRSMDISCVTVENKSATFKIVEHLIKVHHRRRILLLRGPQGEEDSRWRELGYRQALDACHLPFDPDLVGPGNFDRVTSQETIRMILASGIQFDAVFTGDDDAAVGVYSALAEAGLRIPEDVSVAGFDDQFFSSYLNPPLTTVRAPTEQVGSEATRQLVRLIQTGQAEPLILLSTELVIRRSCGCG